MFNPKLSSHLPKSEYLNWESCSKRTHVCIRIFVRRNDNNFGARFLVEQEEITKVGASASMADVLGKKENPFPS